MVFLDFPVAFDSVNKRLFLAKLEPFGLLGGNNLQDVSGKFLDAKDEDQAQGTSRTSNNTTSFLAVYQRPRDCHRCANAVFREGCPNVHKAAVCRAPSTSGR